MRERGLRQVDILNACQPFCEKYGVKLKKSDLSQYVSGKVEPKREKLSILGMALKVNEIWLMGFDAPIERDAQPTTLSELSEKYPEIQRIQLKKIPLLGEIACGEPIYADEEHETYVMAGMDVNADFCLRAKGDSMTNAGIYDGDIVFIRSQPIVENGEIAAVIIDDEATLKRVYYYPELSKIILQPENPRYKPIVYADAELDQIRILGKAVYFMRKL